MVEKSRFSQFMRTADATIEPNVWRLGSFCIEGPFLSSAKIPLKTPDEAKLCVSALEKMKERAM